MSIFGRAGSFLFGDGKRPGILGTGQYEVKAPTVNSGAGRLPGQRELGWERNQGLNEARDRTAPTVAGERIDSGPQSEFRSAQSGLVSDLQAASRGEGPSVAQEQLKQGTQRNLAGSIAASNTIRGAGGAGALRELQARQAATGQQAVADAATLRAQEIAQARSQLASAAQGARGQDLDLATSQAQLSQQANLANQQAEINTRAQKDQLVQYFLSVGLDMAKAEQAANMRMEELRVNAALDVERLRAGAYDSAAGRQGQFARDVASGLAGAIAPTPTPLPAK